MKVCSKYSRSYQGLVTKRRASMSDLKDQPMKKKRKVSMKLSPRKLSNESLSELDSIHSSAKTNWDKVKSYVKHIL